MKKVYEAMRNKGHELFGGFTPTEKKLWGKVMNSSSPLIYLEGIIDGLEVSGVEVSEAFMEFRNYMLENYYNFY